MAPMRASKKMRGVSREESRKLIHTCTTKNSERKDMRGVEGGYEV